MTLRFAFDNSYARLPESFFARVRPTPPVEPRLIRLNSLLAQELGLDPAALSGPEGIEILAGRQVAEGSDPIALAYAGHQFGQFVPQLGDGRAILLGEVIDRSGNRRDIQLKGSGRTPFSRRGDGKAALGPVLREYIVSEAMAALGIPTTRSLAALSTGDTVVRETILPGAVLVRVASSHVRVGTFEYFAARGDTAALRHLVDHVIERHYPEAAGAPNRALAFLEAVMRRQAQLVARWMLVGFIHGVMNTDNMSIAGETIDYGPCAFLDEYDPAKVFSSIDHGGRYAFANQPRIAQWNLARLAEALLALIDDDRDRAVTLAQERIASFVPMFESAYLAGLRAKLGLFSVQDDDANLAWDLLGRLAQNRVDFTLFFRRLAQAASDSPNDDAIRKLFVEADAYDTWAARWRTRLSLEDVDPSRREAAMRAVNPAFIPRNHRIEEAITAAIESDDFGLFHRLVDVLGRPFDEQPEAADLAEPPRPDERVTATFCGT